MMFKETKETLMVLGIGGLILVASLAVVGFGYIKISTDMSADFASTVESLTNNNQLIDKIHPFNNCLTISVDKFESKDLRLADEVCSKLVNARQD